MNEFPCHCPVCTKYTPKKMKKLSKKQRIKLLAEHNLYISFSELRTIREAIKEGNLWDLVEQRVHAHPKLIEGLRVMRKFSEFFDKEVNLSKVKGQNYLMPLSFFRPIFKRYREKSNKYKIPENRTKIVFLPELDVPSDNGNSIKNWLV